MSTQIRDFLDQFKLTDLTEAINLIPNQYGYINSLGLFDVERVTQHTVSFERKEGVIGIVRDKRRGERPQYNSTEVSTIHAYNIPNYPMNDAVSVRDIKGVRAFGTEAQQDPVQAAVTRKLTALKRAHDQTLEIARAQILKDGTVWAPNGTVVANYYTDFSITRKSVDFALGTSTTDILKKIEEARADVEDNLKGESANGFLAICHPTFFANLIAHPAVVHAWEAWQNSAAYLQQRVGGAGVMQRRNFHFGGVDFVEYRGSIDGIDMMQAGEARMIPTGTTSTFKTFYSPADTFDNLYSVGESLYARTFLDDRNTQIEIDTEQNMLNLLARPELVVRLHTSN